MKKVGIIVLNYNGNEFVDSLYPTIFSQTYQDYDLIVIDNDSADGSLEQIKQKYPMIQTVKLKKNYGFANALNYAACKFKHEFLVFLNNDIYAKSDWLENLIKSIERNDKIILGNCKVLFWDYPEYINSAGARISFFGGQIHNRIYEKVEKVDEPDEYIGSAQGVCMIVRRNDFLKIGGFDRKYFVGVEETDFCWRSWILGYRIIYSPKSVLYHKVGFSWNKKPLFLKEYEIMKNRYITIIKNANVLNLLFSLAIGISYDLVLMKRSNSSTKLKAFLSAWRFILKNIGCICNQRINIQKIRRYSDSQLIKWRLFATIFEVFETDIKGQKFMKKQMNLKK